MKSLKYALLLLFISCLAGRVCVSQVGYCSKDKKGDCHVYKPRYIFYDVNSPEGFNLRRDVYLRMSVLVKKLQEFGNWILVLPPWPHMYHWQSQDVGPQNRLPWNQFFDITSMRQFIPVVEMYELFASGELIIDEVYVLQHYKDLFTSGNFDDRFDIEPCQKKLEYYRIDDMALYKGYFWGYNNISAAAVQCLTFHGAMSKLIEVILRNDSQSVMFDRAEIGLHDRFGDVNYWSARRSMRFSKTLVQLANEFRSKYLNSSDFNDKTVRPQDWTEETLERKSIGGSYICVHLRRKDFLTGRNKNLPSLKGAADQLIKFLNKWKLKTVFIATDAPENEIYLLKNHMKDVISLNYVPSYETKQVIKDGGQAIVEQIICSHARAFIGTHESTFSFRIQEEREIMGFNPDTTFNKLCGDIVGKCTQPSQWLIVH